MAQIIGIESEKSAVEGTDSAKDDAGGGKMQCCLRQHGDGEVNQTIGPRRHCRAGEKNAARWCCCTIAGTRPAVQGKKRHLHGQSGDHTEEYPEAR